MISPIFFFMISLIFSCSYASHINDFCVADSLAPKGPAGYSCKDHAEVTVNDFVHYGLGVPANTSNPSKFGITPAFAMNFPGLNGLGISVARIDMGVGGIAPIHSHSGATEVVVIGEGSSITCGFIDSNNKVYHKSLNKGDAMIFPQGLYHFLMNEGKSPAVIHTAFSSESPTTQILDMSLLQSDLGSDIIQKLTPKSIRQSVRRLTLEQQGVNVITRDPKTVVLDNGIIKVTFSNPAGHVIGIQYKGLEILGMKNEEDDRGYWDTTWKDGEATDKLEATKFSVITSTPDQAEISFLRPYDVSLGTSTNIIPLTVDKRYILKRGAPGFYAYGIVERLKGWPAIQHMDQIRIVYRTEQHFHYMAVSDTIQRMMPSAADRAKGEVLAYKEAVILTNPSNPEFRGEVDDKYQFSIEHKDNKVHGWISPENSVGFWMITPSDEFLAGGPFKQRLTSHTGPITLQVFACSHYAGREFALKFEEGEAWKRDYGPVFVYLNSAPRSNNSTGILWNDAKAQMLKEVESWPYNFTQYENFPTSDQRGSVSGQLLVHDRCIKESIFPASSAYVGLAAPGEAGSWQRENKGYQFWNQADKEGKFIIKDVRPGNYSLYASVPGILGDYKYEADISITPGSSVRLDNLTYRPPRNGPTLWEIGIPDRSAAEFYVPDPYPTLLNKLYTNNPSENFRQYGIWKRYGDRYPKNDLVYNVAVNNYSVDWFYAQVTRETGKETFVGTTWQVLFELRNVMNIPGDYTLQLALASVTNAELQVRINNQDDKPHFTTKLIGEDNAIARHGIHGLYWLFSVSIPGSLLKEGKNTIYLTQARGGSAFTGIMYDYIRLEAPSSQTDSPKKIEL